MDRRRIQGFDELDGDVTRIRKRARASTSRRAVDVADEQPIRTTQPTKMPVCISEEKAIWNIYDQRFRGLQQTACKLIAKAWVKLVEPKKQSTHPYTGSDEKAPEWWPKPWGLSRDERVRHKEPDHLYKKERVHLLKHILRMIVVPSAEQHPSIQKLHLNVAKLEEATYEVLSGFFTDKDAPNNARKRPYLAEIFLLAKNEERFRNGEIDGSTNVYVLSDDKLPDNYHLDNDENSSTKDEEEQPPMPGPPTIAAHHRSGTQLLIAPARPALPLIPTNLSPTAPGTEHSPGGNNGSGGGGGGGSGGGGGGGGGGSGGTQPFIGELPHRNHSTYPGPPLLHPEIGSGQHASYVDGGGGGLPVGGGPGGPITGGHGGMSLQEMCPSPHEVNRRTSIFSPTSEYSSTPTPGSVYQTWQQSNTTAPNASPIYSFTPLQTQTQAQVQAQTQAQAQAQAQVQAQAQAHAQHSSFVPQPSVALPPQSQTYMEQFEAMPRNAYGPTHHSMFRPTNVPPHGAVNPQASYTMHMAPHDARGLPPGQGIKVDPHSRGHIH
ncbi:hypothetical protein SPI_09035 [Niveomyces insectorum RCEF 264]|uniref:Subtelomeric hrmA-associated cluster protein AFUB-079030/YDR124W-like helical bundle domain-containing protein n=1 Tax=Niveomyces insectorum RCEF 264 TaxID=1081102 RepID=A0A167M9H9_9HYPO|nr:hypothetical protein SPI_09035 [Niveomyces insectorum RCEF 264]